MNNPRIARGNPAPLARSRDREESSLIASSVVVLLLMSAAVGCGTGETESPTETTEVQSECVRGDFVSSRDSIPADWDGPVFKLNQDYPDTPPEPEALPWDNINYENDPRGYVMAVRDYVYQGNLDPDHPNAPWVVQDNPVRTWYHAPWMDYGNNGREFIHGLTRELTSVPGHIWTNPPQDSSIQNWAVGFYNPRGSYVVGQVWCDPDLPDLQKGQFPHGTVGAKLLFSAASLTQVPFVEGSVEWTANINPSPRSDPPSDRRPQRMRLLQIDIAVRDTNNTYTGWNFGTFIYDPEAGFDNPWENMQPVGLQWGNDPGVTPGGEIEQSWLNPEVKRLMQHYGWAKRLNGPVDNAMSSCLSCHSAAGYPTVSSIPPKDASNSERLKWFRNVPAGEPFDTTQTSLDYSLQLSFGIRAFCQENGSEGAGLFSADGTPMAEVHRSGENSEAFEQALQAIPAAFALPEAMSPVDALCFKTSGQ